MQIYLCATLKNIYCIIALTSHFYSYVIWIAFICMATKKNLNNFIIMRIANPLTLMSVVANISYLDVSVSFDGTNIHTSVCTKSTDRQGYLHYKSFHPIHIKKSIVCSQLIRYKRIRSDIFTFEQHAYNLFQHFLSRYNHFKLIVNELRKVCHRDHNYLFRYNHKTDTNNILNIHDFHPTIQKFNKDINYLWRNLAKNTSTGKLVKTPPIIAYRQPPTLRHILIHCNVNNTSTTLSGNFKSDTERYKICNSIDTRRSFTLPETRSIVKPGSLSCNSFNVVYLITCKNYCNGEGSYVGETSTKF